MQWSRDTIIALVTLFATLPPAAAYIIHAIIRRNRGQRTQDEEVQLVATDNTNHVESSNTSTVATPVSPEPTPDAMTMVISDGFEPHAHPEEAHKHERVRSFYLLRRDTLVLQGVIVRS